MTKDGDRSRQDSCAKNSSPTDKNSPHDRIRELNNKFRQTGIGGTIVITRGIEALASETKRDIINTIKAIDEFTPDNDPYGTHDFGSVKVKDLVIFWKIDCYDLDLIYGSPDPSDPDVTRRVMTIMLAQEY